MTDKLQMSDKLQELAETVHDGLIRTMINYRPFSDIKVGDIKFIAERARSLAWEALKHADHLEGEK